MNPLDYTDGQDWLINGETDDLWDFADRAHEQETGR